MMSLANDQIDYYTENRYACRESLAILPNLTQMQFSKKNNATTKISLQAHGHLRRSADGELDFGGDVKPYRSLDMGLPERDRA